MYVIMRDGMYLGANPGMTGNTWVRSLQNAKIFRNREAAQAEACGNETVVDMSYLVGD